MSTLDYTILAIFIVIALPVFVQWLRNVGVYTPANKAKYTSKKVSVLIPARNEEDKIAKIIEAVLESDVEDFEVLIGDDHSTDSTAQIVEDFAARDSRVRLIAIPELPENWGGKMHTCWNLSEAATGGWLLFLDADVSLTTTAISSMVSEAEKRNVALLSGFPQELTGTFGEKLLIPLIHFVLLGFLSIRRMRGSLSPSYAAACGQIMLFDTEMYRKVGGHKTVSSSCHDGLDIPRLFRRHQLKTDLVDLSDSFTCRMYHNLWDTLVGLEKNAKYGMGSPQLIFVFTFMLLGGQVLPWVLLCVPGVTMYQSIALVVLILMGFIIRIMQCYYYKCSWLGALFHPVGVIVLLSIQWVAFFRNIFGFKSKWKGRSIG